MTGELAFVGDIHGNLGALRGIQCVLDRRGVGHTVFLGDYINKGTESAGVLEELIVRSRSGRATLLAGNHETALLESLDNHDLSAFLKMGGAATIRSYAGAQVGPEVLADLRSNLPVLVLDALRQMPTRYESDTVIAQHIPPRSITHKYCVSAHLPVGRLPLINNYSAQIDTGCGGPGGRLTALLWPSRTFVQVDEVGRVVDG
jgi:serine/threonine protein phosphatase 1